MDSLAAWLTGAKAWLRDVLPLIPTPPLAILSYLFSSQQATLLHPQTPSTVNFLRQKGEARGLAHEAMVLSAYSPHLAPLRPKF